MSETIIIIRCIYRLVWIAWMDRWEISTKNGRPVGEGDSKVGKKEERKERSFPRQ